ncbi:hypothetical protein [Bacillus fonticola]|uniref:hypothetical protein n=1 Tax=Bacillus fonticola TaxID=2728853 RepID=UPI001475725F|nr:hypothetical protein [Bacillus fonticola]
MKLIKLLVFLTAFVLLSGCNRYEAIEVEVVNVGDGSYLFNISDLVKSSDINEVGHFLEIKKENVGEIVGKEELEEGDLVRLEFDEKYTISSQKVSDDIVVDKIVIID